MAWIYQLEDVIPRSGLVPLASPNLKVGAATMDKIESAVGDWDTNIQLLVAADGRAPTAEAKQMTLIQMLPMEISASQCMRA